MIVFLLVGTTESSGESHRQKRFILLKKIMQMSGAGGNADIFPDLTPTPPPAPSCPNIYIQQQQPNYSTPSYNSPAYDYTPSPKAYTTPPPPSYSIPSPSTYNYVPSTPSPPQSRYEQPQQQNRYEQLPPYLQMPPIYKPPAHVPEQSYNPPVQTPPSSYQSPLVQHQMF